LRTSHLTGSVPTATTAQTWDKAACHELLHFWLATRWHRFMSFSLATFESAWMCCCKALCHKHGIPTVVPILIQQQPQILQAYAGVACTGRVHSRPWTTLATSALLKGLVWGLAPNVGARGDVVWAMGWQPKVLHARLHFDVKSVLSVDGHNLYVKLAA
jgi:hypothetical protein